MAEDADDPVAAASAWRAGPGRAADPVRARFVEALARRAASRDGAARRAIAERLARAMAEAPTRADETLPPARPAPGPLAAMLAELKRPPLPGAPMPAPVRRPGAPAPQPARETPAELDELDFFRRTWARLAADQRLAQSASALPENAGPLNSQHLVHRALTLMRDLSPAYLERFVAHVDALLWIDAATGGDTPLPRPRRG